MAEPCLILCGGERRTAAPRGWWRACQVSLEIGSGADVHLALRQLTDRMCKEVPDVALDLLELAAFVYAADQAITRGGTTRVDYGDDWRRRFRFQVPVRRPAVWNRPDVRAALAGALEFLTDDVYEFGFRRAENPRRSDSYLFQGSPGGTEFDEVVLFSGGLDSLCGAVEEVLVSGRRVLLVSHRSSTRVFARQQALFDALRGRVPKGGARPVHVAVTINKGEEHNHEFTQRSRSFVFASVAAVVALLAGRERIRFYENGVTSLNLPVSPELVGARASRTTHPQVLARFRRFLSLLFDTAFDVENPFQPDTKADMLVRLKDRGHADLAALTCSCGHVWGQEEKHPHCGRCSQCVDRRLSALAAGLSAAEDPEERYESDPLTGEREGPDLTFAERYVGMAREIERIGSPQTFATRYPEVNAALPYLGCPPEQAVEACFKLYRRHAAGMCRAIQEALAARAGELFWQAFPAHSLLGAVLGRAASAPSGPDPTPGPEAERGFVVDRARFEVRLDGRPCPMGNTMEFRLVERLHRGRGVYLPIETLGRDVWDDAGVPKNNVQRAACSARRRLREHGLSGVEIDGDANGHHRLVLQSGESDISDLSAPPPARHQRVGAS
ncbi:MAG: queC 2 [Gemmataceae bacterium]|nr:queC 2 [Gemmataceae bacterium]